jgi:hypothetical protein
MRRLLAVLTMACAGVIAAASCGGEEADTPGAEATTEVTTTVVTTTEAAIDETTTEETVTEVIDEACAGQVGPLVTQLSELDSRLNVGLNFERYSNFVSDAQVAYDKIPIGELSPDYVNRVGVPAERAFNAYVKAYNIWNNCIGNINCDNDSITPRLQARWAKATASVVRADRGLESLSG